MARLKLEASGYTFTVKDFEGFQMALHFLSVEKGLTGIDLFNIATPWEFRVLSWLPTGVKIDHGNGNYLYVRRIWNQLSEHIKDNEELAALARIKERLASLIRKERSSAWFAQQTGIEQSCWEDIGKGKKRPTDSEIEAAIKLLPGYALWIISGQIAPTIGQTNPEYDEANEQLAAHLDGKGYCAQKTMTFTHGSFCRMKFCRQSVKYLREGDCDFRCWGTGPRPRMSKPEFDSIIASMPDEFRYGRKGGKCPVHKLRQHGQE